MSVVLEAALPILITRLIDGLHHVVTKHKKTKTEIRKWEKKLSTLHGVLRDAHEKQSSNSEIGRWLDDIEDLAYDVEDFLEHFKYEVKRRQQKELSGKKIIRWFSDYRIHAKLSSRLESITEKLDDLIDRKEFLGLAFMATSSKSTSSIIHSRMEGPIQPETETVVYGRDDEKKAIIEFVLKSEPGVGVYPIVGMGGIGKTTLARYAYNYNYKYGEQFEKKAWITISKEYNRVRVYKGIIEYVTSDSCSLEDPGAIMMRVEEVLQGKKFLIVIDDLWAMKVSEWSALTAPLMKGGAGSKIIVTTRSSEVADVVRTVESYVTLYGLSEADSWLLFCRCADVDNDPNFESNLGEIGRKIVAKLSRLPLAIRVVGSLLRWKKGKEDWEAILNSTSVAYKDEMDTVMSVLRTSFDCLPYCLKNCFLFCAMFPEDHELEENRIVTLLVAAGFIVCEEQSQDLAKLGRSYLAELASRSLLTRHPWSGYYQMHDMIRDMANEASGNKFYCWENEKEGSIERMRHLFFESSMFNEIVKSVSHTKENVLPLRLIISVGERLSTIKDVDIMFTKLRNARVISLPYFLGSDSLPKSIGEMKLLTYLDLQGWTNLETLPSQIGRLINLSTLILRSCANLIKLPAEIGMLTNLSTLELYGCDSLIKLPAEIGMLTNLSTLELYGCDSLIKLPAEIGMLTNLSTLDLSFCKKLIDLPAKIGMLTNLSTLDLSYCKKLIELPAEIGMLTNLSTLDISDCKKLIELPAEIGMLTSLSTLDLSHCKKLIELPAKIGMLTNLSNLKLRGCDSLIKLPAEIGMLSNLSTLDVSFCVSLIELPAEIGMLTNLSTLDLFHCKKLIELPAEIGMLTNLSTLQLKGCYSLIKLPAEIGMLTNLSILDLSDCQKLIELPGKIGMLTNLFTPTYLIIRN